MKSLRVFLCLLVAGALMTACEKENVESLLETSKQQTFNVDEYMDAYLKKHGEVKIEHLSLEELNNVLVENGIKPVTLEEIGLTQEEYEAGQARINNPNFAYDRCSASNIMGMGDINQSGAATTFDCVLAIQAIQGGAPFSISEQAFGEISIEVINVSPSLTSLDVYLLYAFILGNLPQCN